MVERDKDYMMTLLLSRLIGNALQDGFRPMVLPTVCGETYLDLAHDSNLRLFEVAYKGKGYGYLRPEGTKLHLKSLDQTFKGEQAVFYWGPMFRLEREQYLRRREFHQFCLEMTGRALVKPEVRCLTTLMRTLRDFCDSSQLVLRVNYLGERDSLEKRLEKMAISRNIPVSKVRLLLDQGRESFNVWHLLTPTERLKFLTILSELRDGDINPVVETSLIRGLHYYNRFVFELNYGDKTIAGGGRYDGLWGSLNKRKSGYQHFGWGLGMTRLTELMQSKKENDS